MKRYPTLLKVLGFTEEAESALFVETKAEGLKVSVVPEEDGLQVVATLKYQKAGELLIKGEYVNGEEDENSYPFGAYCDQPFFQDLLANEMVINIQHLEVEEEFRGQGVAKALMDRGMKEIKKKFPGDPIYINASPMGSGERISLDALIDFYKKYGFKELVRYPEHQNALLWKE